MTSPADSCSVDGRICDSGLKEEVREVILHFPHSKTDDLTLFFYNEDYIKGNDQLSAFSQENGATWAISDVRLYVDTCSGGSSCKVVTQ